MALEGGRMEEAITVECRAVVHSLEYRQLSSAWADGVDERPEESDHSAP